MNPVWIYKQCFYNYEPIFQAPIFLRLVCCLTRPGFFLSFVFLLFFFSFFAWTLMNPLSRFEVHKYESGFWSGPELKFKNIRRFQLWWKDSFRNKIFSTQKYNLYLDNFAFRITSYISNSFVFPKPLSESRDIDRSRRMLKKNKNEGI